MALYFDPRCNHRLKTCCKNRIKNSNENFNPIVLNIMPTANFQRLHGGRRRLEKNTNYNQQPNQRAK
jgi:hypothetical protein